MRAPSMLFVSLLAVAALLLFAKTPDSLDIYFFHGLGCPHCAKEDALLRRAEEKYAVLNVHRHEVYYNATNMDLFRQVAAFMNAEVGSVPFLVIGGECIIGYSESVTPGLITTRIEDCLSARCPDPIRNVLLKHSLDTESPLVAAQNATDKRGLGGRKTLTLPMLGEIDPHVFSLPVLTMVMGFLDGFNPCAMWTLLFLISLLLGMRDKAKMWTLGAAFIVASALVYFLFMAAWLNVILLFGFVIWIRVAIGVLALGSGVHGIREFWLNPEGTCKLSNNQRRQRVYEKIRGAINQHSLILSLCGIVLLAFMVNLVEIICSAGFPAIYTQVLSLNRLSTLEYHGYIALYIVFFMLDDFLVFVTTMITLEITGMTTKYVRLARLFGGILMLLIGILLIARPQWLMFG